MYINKNIYTYIYIYIYVCIYVIHVYKPIHVHIYIYISIRHNNNVCVIFHHCNMLGDIISLPFFRRISKQRINSHKTANRFAMHKNLTLEYTHAAGSIKSMI